MEGIQHRRFREVEHQRREGSGCARRIYNMGEGRQFYRRRATGTPADAISYATSSPARPFYRDLSRRGPQLRERAPSPSSRLITPEALGDAWTPTLPVQGVVGYIAQDNFRAHSNRCPIRPSRVIGGRGRPVVYPRGRAVLRSWWYFPGGFCEHVDLDSW